MDESSINYYAEIVSSSALRSATFRRCFQFLVLLFFRLNRQKEKRKNTRRRLKLLRIWGDFNDTWEPTQHDQVGMVMKFKVFLWVGIFFWQIGKFTRRLSRLLILCRIGEIKKKKKVKSRISGRVFNSSISHGRDFLLMNFSCDVGRSWKFFAPQLKVKSSVWER